MAFNPFVSFRKYQKFWMASLVLLSMITFVLCAGIGGGGLEDMLSRLFGRKGQEVASLYGRSVTREQLYRLKLQRQVANEFMRKAADLSLKHLTQIQKDLYKSKAKSKEKADPKRLQEEHTINAMLADLQEVLKKPRYFEGGIKLQDLLDFMLWQHEADQLGVRLEQPQLALLIQRGIHGQTAQIGPYEYRYIQNEVRQVHFEANDDLIMDSVRQEFRVRIARLARLGVRPYALLSQRERIPAFHEERKVEIRQPLAPEQLWQFYRKNRSSMDIALVPIPASKFLDKVASPNDVQLEGLFTRHKADKLDPASPLPGFELPQQVKITWVTVDPRSEFVKGLAALTTTLDAAAPATWAPSLAPVAFREALERDYENLKRNPRNQDRYEDVPLTEPYTALGLYTHLYELYGKPKPEMATALVGSAAGPGLFSGFPAVYQAAAYLDQGDKLTPVLKAEAQRRIPVGATLVLAGASPIPFSVPALWDAASPDPRFHPDAAQYLPLAVVEKEVREGIEQRLGRDWAREVMKDVKKELEQDRNATMALRLEQVAARYPALEVHRTYDFLNQFDLSPEGARRLEKDDPAKAAALKELEGLRESFEQYRTEINNIEGRGGTERMLKDEDFYKLFFSSGEPFSVGNTIAYDPRIWPPVATIDQKKLALNPEIEEEKKTTIDLWASADKPILFWKSDVRPALRPEGLAQVRPEVERAWRLAKAREELALPRAKEIAEAVRKVQTQRDPKLYDEEMTAAAKKLGVDVIRLNGVTPLVPATRAELGFTEWQPYTLPKDKRDLLVYPTEDMTKELLALGDLKAPLQITVKDAKKDVEPLVKRLNEINKSLFDKSLKPDAPIKQVQILTNRPRTVFYVAAVVAEHPANETLFVASWGGSLDNFGMMAGRLQILSLLDRAQEEAGREFEAAFLRQLREQAKQEISDPSFDTEGGP
jgi:hypothetical protein